MALEQITLTRAELYEKVWTSPMQKLANEFGLSDVGLAKLCRRHDIPLPGRGYWARIQFGQKPGRAPLPAPKEPRRDTIRIFPSEPKGREDLMPDVVAVFPTIEVAENRLITHPVARRIERSMARKTMDDRGILATRQGRDVPFKLTAGGLHRALSLIDALFTALDESKHTFEWPSPYNTPLKIVSDGEKLQFTITEVVERQEHKPTKEELARQKEDAWWRPPRWDYAPTSRFKLTLMSSEYANISQSWTDGKRRKLDICMREVLVTCHKMTAAIKKEREDRAERERRWKEEEKRRLEEAARKAEYDRKAKGIKELARAWQESNLLRNFAAALQAEVVAATDLPEDTKHDLQAMVEWSVRNADYVDPLTDLKWTLGQFKSPSWQSF